MYKITFNGKKKISTVAIDFYYKYAAYIDYYY